MFRLAVCGRWRIFRGPPKPSSARAIFAETNNAMSDNTIAIIKCKKNLREFIISNLQSLTSNLFLLRASVGMLTAQRREEKKDVIIKQFETPSSSCIAPAPCRSSVGGSPTGQTGADGTPGSCRVLWDHTPSLPNNAERRAWAGRASGARSLHRATSDRLHQPGADQRVITSGTPRRSTSNAMTSRNAST